MKRAFVSFDFDEDQSLRHFFAGQFRLPESPFVEADWSMKEAAPQKNWELEAESKIKRSDIMVVLVGRTTHIASDVRKEVAIVCRLRKPIVQRIGCRDSHPTLFQTLEDCFVGLGQISRMF